MLLEADLEEKRREQQRHHEERMMSMMFGCMQQIMTGFTNDGICPQIPSHDYYSNEHSPSPTPNHTNHKD